MWYQVSLKLVPSDDRPDGRAFVVPVEVTIVMASFCHELSLMDPVCPLRVADAPVILVVPKSANGSTPPEDDGASTIHSADERWALAL